MNFKTDPLIQTAVRAVLKACKLSSNVQDSMLEGENISKSDRSPVTVGDFGAQAIVSHLLAGSFPDIPLMAEEDSSQLTQARNVQIKNQVISEVSRIEAGLDEAGILRAIDRGRFAGGAGGRFWCLDPIDGTKGFLRREQFAVALALIEDGEVRLGLLGCPNLPININEPDGDRGCLFLAARGQGAFVTSIAAPDNFTQIRVDDHEDPASVKFCESVESAHSSHDDSKRIARLLKVNTDPIRMDSQCKYGIVARGEASIYLRLPKNGVEVDDSHRYIEKIWDHAAGSIIIEEAGGRVTDIYGSKLDFGKGALLIDGVGVIVTNGFLHDKVLLAVQDVLGIKSH